MIFQQALPDKPARVTAKKLLNNHNDSIETGFTVPAEKWRSIMKIDKQKNTFSEHWISFDAANSKPKLNASTYSVRTMDNMGLLEDQAKPKRHPIKRITTNVNTYRSLF